MSFAQTESAMKKKVTRRERFLGEMEEVVPWEKLVEVIRPHYPTRGARASSDRDGADAAHLFPPAVVWAGR